MKRKLEEDFSAESEFEVYIPPRRYKRISMCDNTPKQAKDEKKQIMNTSERKLKQLKSPEQNLLRSLLVNNVHRALEAELKQGKHEYYGFGFNPMCPLGYDKSPRDISDRKRQAKLDKILKQKQRDSNIVKHKKSKVEPNMKDCDNPITNSRPNSDCESTCDMQISTPEVTDTKQTAMDVSAFSFYNNLYYSYCYQASPTSNYLNDHSFPTTSNQPQVLDNMEVDVEDDEIIDVCSIDDDAEEHQQYVNSSAQLLLLQSQRAKEVKLQENNNSEMEYNPYTSTENSSSIESTHSDIKLDSTCDQSSSNDNSFCASCTKNRTNINTSDKEYIHQLQKKSLSVLTSSNQLNTNKINTADSDISTQAKTYSNTCYFSGDNKSSISLTSHEVTTATTTSQSHKNTVNSIALAPSLFNFTSAGVLQTLGADTTQASSGNCSASLLAAAPIYQGYIFPAALQQYYGYLPQFHQQHVQGIYH